MNTIDQFLQDNCDNYKDELSNQIFAENVTSKILTPLIKSHIINTAKYFCKTELEYQRWLLTKPFNNL